MMVEEKWNIFLTVSGVCGSLSSEPAATEQWLQKFQGDVGQLSKKKKKGKGGWREKKDEHFNLCKEELSLHLVC